MPVYEFHDETSGARAEIYYPVGQAPDQITLKRVRIPSRVGVCTGARPPSSGEQLMAGYRKLEEKPGGLPKRPRGFTADQIKRACAMPDV